MLTFKRENRFAIRKIVTNKPVAKSPDRTFNVPYVEVIRPILQYLWIYTVFWKINGANSKVCDVMGSS